MKKPTPIQKAQAELIMGYLENFKQWPKTISYMLDWEIGFFNRKSRKKDLLVVLNYLGEIGKIQFETVEGLNGNSEIGFRLVQGA